VGVVCEICKAHIDTIMLVRVRVDKPHATPASLRSPTPPTNPAQIRSAQNQIFAVFCNASGHVLVRPDGCGVGDFRASVTRAPGMSVFVGLFSSDAGLFCLA
jgi:hypothetical protein